MEEALACTLNPKLWGLACDVSHSLNTLQAKGTQIMGF